MHFPELCGDEGLLAAKRSQSKASRKSGAIQTLFLIYALWQNDLITLMLKPVAAHLKFWLISSEQF